jgi:hypothetical protein
MKMISGLFLCAAMLLSIIGCGYYALSQHSHWKIDEPMKTKKHKKIRMRLFSLFSLIMSLVIFIIEEAEFAALLWPLSIGLGIFIIGMILAYKPSILSRLM